MPPQIVTVKNAGKIAAALQNEKCQRILDHLGKHKDATETDLAKALSLPLSTVHYNMKVLSDAQLVQNDVYSYSSRGKQVTHYRVNKNPIVIVQEEPSLDLLKAIVPAAVVAAGIGIVYQFATQGSVANSAPTAQYAADAAPSMMRLAAAPIAQESATHATSLPFFPSFILGIVAVLIISFIAVLLARWWNGREQ